MWSTNGSLRLHVDGVGGSAEAARLAEQCLRGIAGVRRVSVDTRTGSVAVLYEPARVPEVLPPAAIAVREPRAVAIVEPPPVARLLTWVARTVVVVGLEMAIQRTLGSFFPPRRC